MADEPLNIQPESGDILGSFSFERKKESSDKSFKTMEDSLSDIAKGIDGLHSDFVKFVADNRTSNAATAARNFESASSKQRSSSFRSSTSSSKGSFDDVFDGFEESLADHLGVPSPDQMKNAVSKALDVYAGSLASIMGVDENDLAKEFTKKLSSAAFKGFDAKHPKIAQQVKKVSDWYSSGVEKAFTSISESIYQNIDVPDSLKQKVNAAVAFTEYDRQKGSEQGSPSPGDYGQYSGSASSSISDMAKDAILEKTGVGAAMSGAGEALLTAGASFATTGDVAAVTTAAKSVVGGLARITPQLAIAGAALVAIDGLTEDLQEFVSNMGKAWDKITSGADRWEESLQASLEAQEARMQADVETIIKKPFEILEDAANKVYDVWDATLQTITATQGYDKSGLQDLMSAYASRLREEGLSDVVGTTDVTSMLQQILNAGLSGAAAEEFAYQATVLNKAIPTEDFTSYASSYASLAASYMNLGYSQQEALEYANEQLQTFASNVLTASREVSGGFTTSLTGVSSMFEDIVKVAQTAGVSDTSGLSSALSIVQAIAGQVSPDVGNSLVSQIVEAAIGGNDSNLVALRSLAGTGASNTAFLKALSSNPNQVLANLFSGLNDMFDKSTDNYMEVAYSLAETFGVSADALARIDWEKLVEELRTNSSSTNALSQNMQLLESGETTTSAEAQRIAQINQYMIEEGLSYVLDNEAARAIQEHMWQQEIAEELQQSTYAVDFAGGAKEIMTNLFTLFAKLVKTLTLGIIDIAGIATAAMDYGNIMSDIKAVLEAGKVGEGNASDLKKLTTYDLNFFATKGNYAPSLMDYWGVDSKYYGTQAATYNISKALSGSNANSPSSMYSWTDAGKSSLSLFENYTGAKADLEGVSSSSATSQISKQTSAGLTKWIDSMQSYIQENKSFEDWYSSAKDYGFSDVGSTLEDMGYTVSDLQNAYVDQAADYATEQAVQNKALESQFWNSGIRFWDVTHPAEVEAWNAKFDQTMLDWKTTFSTEMSNWSNTYVTTMQAFVEHLDVKYEEWSNLYSDSVEETNKKLQYANNAFDSSFVNDFLYEWKDYYIGNHTHYREATGYDKSIRTINAEKRETGEAVLALAQSLTKNYQDLADPTVQTNVLLGQILIVLQSILTAQQSGKGLTLPTALASLGLNIDKTKQ